MRRENGFTLIELSIALVIIGLIVGGILVGQDLTKAAEVRAQLSQIEKYDSAVNTFRAKFGALPGDMALATANQYGLTAGTNCDGVTLGHRDGNGLIDGGVTSNIFQQTTNETGLSWQDISSSVAGNLIEGVFPNSNAPGVICGEAVVLSVVGGTSYIGDYVPAGKIGHGTFVYIYETSGYNWYGLSTVTATNSNGMVSSTPSLPVVQAYNTDKKIDDSLPTTGVVQAVYLNGSNITIQNASSAATDFTTTCCNTTSNAYSMSSLANYGASGNCALSFRFQ